MTILTVTIHDEVLSKVMFSSRILLKNFKFQKKISNLIFCSVTNYNITLHKMRSLLAHNLGKNIKKNTGSNYPVIQEETVWSASELEIDFVAGEDNLFSCAALFAYINVPKKFRIVKRKFCMKCRRRSERTQNSACV